MTNPAATYFLLSSIREPGSEWNDAVTQAFKRSPLTLRRLLVRLAVALTLLATTAAYTPLFLAKAHGSSAGVLAGSICFASILGSLTTALLVGLAAIAVGSVGDRRRRRRPR